MSGRAIGTVRFFCPLSALLPKGVYTSIAKALLALAIAAAQQGSSGFLVLLFYYYHFFRYHFPGAEPDF
jgi:hypothetical protein